MNTHAHKQYALLYTHTQKARGNQRNDAYTSTHTQGVTIRRASQNRTQPDADRSIQLHDSQNYSERIAKLLSIKCMPLKAFIHVPTEDHLAQDI